MIHAFKDSVLDLIPFLKHGFFSRQGGVSTNDFSSLNCGFIKPHLENKDLAENIEQNRKLAMGHLELDSNTLHLAHQTHSNNIKIIDKNSPQFLGSWEDGVDGLITQTPGVALGIYTADCAPIFIVVESKKTIAALHAGWKGTLNEIVVKAVDMLKELGCNTQNMEAVIGPCIHQPSYEVDQEFYKTFITKNAENERFFAASQNEGHYLFDLPGYNFNLLKNCGVENTRIMPFNTYEDETNFFSFRKATHQNKNTGNQISIISMTE